MARRELSSIYSTIEKQFQTPVAKKPLANKTAVKTPLKKPVAKKISVPKAPTV
jgi:hypothetical protein